MAIQSTFGLTLTTSDGQGVSMVKSPSGLSFPFGMDFDYVFWQNIGVAAPTNVTAVESTTGGSFTAGTYYWKITALNGTGETDGSAEVTVTTTGSTSSVALSWAAMNGATSYKIYRGTSSGSEDHYFTSTTNSLLDTGTTGSSGSVPGSNTTGTTWTPTLSVTPLQAFYVRNLSPTNYATVAWTPTGGSSATIIVLAPMGAILFMEPTAVSGGGITALTVTASAPGTPVEGYWVA